MASLLFGLSLWVSAAVPAQSDARVEILHTNVPGWAESAVPGHPGLEFRSGRFKSLDVAPNGRWALQADTNGTPYEVIVRDGVVVLEVGQPAPWFPSEDVSSIKGFSLDATGRLLVACWTKSSSSLQGWVVRERSGAWQVEAQTGGSVPGLVGATWGTLFENPVAVGNGEVAFSADGVQGVTSNQDELLWQDGAVLAQQNVDVPLGQFGGGSTPWGGFDLYDGLDVSANGQHWLSKGWLWNGGSAGPDIVTWDGVVQLQDGHLVPGSNFTQTVSWIRRARIAHDGSWWAGGWNGSGNESWVVRDGQVYARDGDPVAPGSSKTWSSQQTAAFTFAASNAGRTYLAGEFDWTFGSIGLLASDQEVLFEVFDPIDRDLNGLFDDNVEFRGFSLGGAGVDQLGRLICVLRMRDLSTGLDGEALVRITPGGPLLNLSNVVAGAQATMELSGGTPGRQAVFAFSLAGGGPTPLATPFGEILLAVSAPYTQTAAVPVDANGDAQWTQSIPLRFAGAQAWVHAAEYDAGGLALTNARFVVIQ